MDATLRRKRITAPLVLFCTLCLISSVVRTEVIAAGEGEDGQTTPVPVSTGTQSSSVTGRHTPAPITTSQPRYKIAVGAGVLTSGDLFKIEVVSGNPQPWLTPAGSRFNSEEFVVTLDEDLVLAATLSYRLGGQWWLRGDLSFAKLDATAEALVGQTVELHLYDRLSCFMAGLTVERPLVSTSSYPFVLAGVALVSIQSDHAPELDQSGLGWRLGAGYHQSFASVWGLRLELRDTIYQIDTLQHQPTNLNPLTPEISQEQYGPQNLFELAILIQRVF